MTEEFDITPPADTSEKPNVCKAAPQFSKAGLIRAETPGIPADIAAALLKDGTLYTKEQARAIISAFLEREV